MSKLLLGLLLVAVAGVGQARDDCKMYAEHARVIMMQRQYVGDLEAALTMFKGSPLHINLVEGAYSLMRARHRDNQRYLTQEFQAKAYLACVRGEVK